MKGRFIFMLFLALVFASLAALIAKSWIDKQINSKGPATTPVVVGAMEIPFGVKVEPMHVKIMQWPDADIPEGSFRKTEDVIGKIAKNNFYPNEPITAKRIAEHLGGSTLSSLVSENSRAISIRVDDVVGVAGFVLPGNRVDVLSTQAVRRNGESNAETHTILENIKVLAVDQEASPDKEKPAVVRAVTLELKPEEAETLVAAMQEGKIQLTLRNPVDSNKLKETQPVPQVAADAEAAPKLDRTVLLLPWNGDPSQIHLEHLNKDRPQ
jgi:pilus assembly protein CpaB